MDRQRKGELEGARSCMETSVKMAPNAWGGYYTLAEVLEKLGRLDEARRAREGFARLRAEEDVRMKSAFYNQEIERNPESPDAHYQLAAYLMSQRDRKGASTELGCAISLAKKHPP